MHTLGHKGSIHVVHRFGVERSLSRDGHSIRPTLLIDQFTLEGVPRVELAGDYTPEQEKVRCSLMMTDWTLVSSRSELELEKTDHSGRPTCPAAKFAMPDDADRTAPTRAAS